MAKPILVIDIVIEYVNDIDIKNLQNNLTNMLDNEYHIVVRYVAENPTIQCFNDCKGLPDIDIEALIKEAMK